MKQSIILFAALATLTQPAWSSASDPIYRCGPHAGHAYFLSGLFVNEANAGWHKDGTSEGWVLLWDYDGDAKNMDLVFKTADGRVRSTKDQGGYIVPLSHSKDETTILVNYSGEVTEVWQFDRPSKTYQMTSMKYGSSLIRKAAAFAGFCE